MTTNMMPIVATLHTDERTSGTPSEISSYATMRHMTTIRPDDYIAPNEGLGGLKLRTPLKELEHLLWAFDVKRGEARDWYYLDTLYEAKYDIGPVIIGVDVRNGKVFKLIAQEGYAGKLFGAIEVGMNVGEAMSLEPRLFYDEVEEGLYVRGCAGVTLDVAERPPSGRSPKLPHKRDLGLRRGGGLARGAKRGLVTQALPTAWP
jgi:hypothetical protein